MKELSGGMNGTETPEDGEEAADEVKSIHTLHHRGHATKGSRSMSPVIGRGAENGHHSIAANMNGRSGSPPRFDRSAGAGSTRDSFLNYFFGKEGGLPSAGGLNAIGGTAAAAAAGNRHVSHNAEPSFSQSIRRGNNRHNERSLPMQPHYSQDEYDMNTGRDYNDYDSQFVSPSPSPPNL